MSNIPPNYRDHPDQSPPESEILLGRLVDGEATADDRARFEMLAGGDPSLWRRLALHQNEMAILTSKFEEDIRSVETVNVPQVVGGEKRSSAGGWFRLVAYSGWAAALLLATVWWIAFVNQGSEQSRAKPVITDSPPDLSYDEHRLEYMKAPYVVGEMAPTMLQREVMSDGRTAIRFLRRVEEVLFLPEGAEPPTDQDGAFTTDPSRLRGDETYRLPSN
jgi:hypothetical protein